MKKLFLILALLISSHVFAQGLDVNFHKVKDYPSFTLASDTSYTVTITNDYIWAVQIVWSNADSLDASVSIEHSMDGVNYVAYPGIATVALNTVSGTAILRDVSGGIIEKYFRIKILHGTNTGGTLKIYERLISRE